MSSISATVVRPKLKRSITAAVVAAALAGGTLAIVLNDNTTAAPSVPAPAQATGSAQDLSSYDPALLHRHGVETPRVESASTDSTRRQRAAAERFHHRR